jgi:RHS repeat-associated protein
LPQGAGLYSWRDLFALNVRAAGLTLGVLTDVRGNTTTYSYDAGRRTAVTDGNGAVTTTLYDNQDHVTQVTDANNWSTTYNYDDAGLKTAATDPQGQTATYAYDGDKRLTSMTDRLGRRTDYAYDHDGRPTGEKWWSAPDPVSGVVTLLDTRTYTYDPDGNRTSAANGLGTYSYHYDDANRVSATTDLWGLTLTLGYDTDGNRTLVQDSKGGTTTSTYDFLNRLTTLSYSDTSTQLRFDVGWTPRGEMASLTRYRDVAGMQQAGISSYTYDPVSGLVRTIYHYGGGTPALPYSGSVLASYVYSYDPGQRLSTEQDNGAATTPYQYDRANQVTADAYASYTWDAAGNRTNANFSQGTNQGNQLATDGTWNYSYDFEGNLTGKAKVGGGDVWTYTYDNANELTSAEGPATPGGTVTVHLDYKYDALGRRVERDVTSQGSTTYQRYGYDTDGNVWADLDGSGTLVTRRVYGDGVDQPVARVNYGGTVTVGWYLADRQGTVTGLMSNAGALSATQAFDAFGKLRSVAPIDRYGYTGREQDEYTGWQYNRARWYDPATQRWASRDPLEFGAGDGNLYRYVGNNATNATDPTGLLFALGLLTEQLVKETKEMELNALALRYRAGYSFGSKTAEELDAMMAEQRRFSRTMMPSRAQLLAGTNEEGQDRLKKKLKQEIPTLPTPEGAENDPWWVGYQDAKAGVDPVEGFRRKFMPDPVPVILYIIPPPGARGRPGPFRQPMPVPPALQALENVGGARPVRPQVPARPNAPGPQGGAGTAAAPEGGFRDPTNSAQRTFWEMNSPARTPVTQAAAQARGGTYVLRDPVTGRVMRSGRTNNLARRQAEHALDPALRDYRFEVAHRTDVYAEQRGLEQLLHETHKPPLNKIRGIDLPRNPRLPEYREAARRFLQRQQGGN